MKQWINLSLNQKIILLEIIIMELTDLEDTILSPHSMVFYKNLNLIFYYF